MPSTGSTATHLPWRSAPVQKARPTPVMMPTHKLSSWSKHSHISAISRLVALLMLFSFSGLFKVTWIMCSCGKEI